ncbi:MAG: HAMP domain-containing histidine kinase [Dysgonamonadaceae bacterium]|nr:HAMP domain-containing histidine kinase [Dysgonamonadaceae bacterium]
MKNNILPSWNYHKYRQWIFFYLLFVFMLFATLGVVFVSQRSKSLRIESLKLNQGNYANVVSEYIDKNSLFPQHLDSLKNIIPLFPNNLRITILNKEGKILFDNSLSIKDKVRLENQKKKIEIKKAYVKGEGWSIRKSEIAGCEYMFYAVYKKDYVLRLAVPFTEKERIFLKPQTSTLSFTALMFVCIFIFLLAPYIFLKISISRLKTFVLSFGENKTYPNKEPLPDNELREIQNEIIKVFEQLEIKKRDAVLEREKLLEHFHFSEEGISFFTPFFENIYTNSYFIQYLNILLNEPMIDVCNMFQSPVLSDVLHFLKNPQKENIFTNKLHVNGRYFFLRVIIFEDKSFEIIIRDISDTEKDQIDKAEVANNIAHELRTPVTSVRGYLETLIERDNMLPEKKQEYIERAYNQIVRLSQIMQDVILLNKTGNAPQYFDTEPINICDMLTDMIELDMERERQKHNCTVNIYVTKDVVIKGNRTLMYSIFSNLFINALKYAGENITVTIHNYMEDNEFYYFSFSDNGVGIEEKYLDHIFERFYRINQIKNRDKSGSGLGLSIVKEAVHFHKGVIHAKNRAQGGLEFLFTIRKQ